MRRLSLLLILVLITSNSMAQISQSGNPPSWTQQMETAVPTFQLPFTDVSQLLQEDEQEFGKAIPKRFGKAIEVQLNLDNAGQWQTLPNGDKVWQLRFHSADAYSLNFIFSQFYMPEGAELYLYNDDHSYKIGAFTSQNNKAHYGFSTAPVKGEAVTLEYYEPFSVQGEGQLEVSKVIHAYRNIFQTAQDMANNAIWRSGRSGACNVDVNCPEGGAWYEQIRSVAMIVTDDGTRLCTGQLVNNMTQDKTPYFLTAQHCLPGNNDVSNWIFAFNYHSPTCGGGDGTLTQSISGAVLKASWNLSDFALLELSSQPPQDYAVYYAGWDKSGVAGDSSVCIHHPNGDVKKITLDYNAITTSPNDTDLWRIEQWELGTTEPGSSGAALFDKNHRIIGQLSGGLASCDVLDYDDYGKFSASWEGGGTPNTRLKDWLDPNGENQAVLDGINDISFTATDDVELISIGTFSNCGAAQYPKVLVKNLGSNAIDSLYIEYQFDGYAPQGYGWMGLINPLQTVEIALPGVSLPVGSHSFSTTVKLTNDQDTSNNTQSTQFVINSLEHNITVALLSDTWPQELTYQIRDDQGSIVFEVLAEDITGEEFKDTLLEDQLCLPDGCYDAVIFDSFGDGLEAPAYFGVLEADSMLNSASGDFGDSAIFNFCIPNLTLPPPPPPVNTNPIHSRISLDIYPNPSNGRFYFDVSERPEQIMVFDVVGRTLSTIHAPRDNWLDITSFNTGVYLVSFVFEEGVITRRVIKQ